MEEVQETKELVTYSPQSLISQALAQNLPIETLERLMDLAERWDEKQAKSAYLKAMSEFQSIVPILTKKKKVAFNTTKYSYTPISDIVNGIKDAEAKTGLSHRWELQELEDNIICTCIISHIGGHSEKNTMSAKRDPSGNKNEIQSRGSAVTYLQRYTLIGALGLSTADEDNDGKTTATVTKETITAPQKKTVEPQYDVEILKKIENAKTIPELEKLYVGLTELEKPVYLGKLSDKKKLLKKAK